MTGGYLREQIQERILRVRDAANTCPPTLWARLYAEALDDIAGLVGFESTADAAPLQLPDVPGEAGLPAVP
jgi:hypothetical protein